MTLIAIPSPDEARNYQVPPPVILDPHLALHRQLLLTSNLWATPSKWSAIAEDGLTQLRLDHFRIKAFKATKMV